MSKLTEMLSKIQSLEELAERETVIHKLHPIVKIIVTITFLVAVISFGKYNISGLAPLFLYPAFLMALGEIPYRTVFSRLLIALPFAFFAGLSNLFLDHDPALTLMSIPISFGALSFLSILLKTVLTVMAVLILIATTPMDKLANALIRMKIPKVFVIQLMLSYRYLGLLICEAANMLMAYHLRSLRQTGVSIEHAGTFLGQLLLRSFDRAERVYAAMKCRGYNGEYQISASRTLSVSDVLLTLAAVLVIFFIRYFNISILIGRLIV